LTTIGCNQSSKSHPYNLFDILLSDEKGIACDYYGYQWWIDPLNPEIYYARGILGQFIIMVPSKKTIIVRLGKTTSKERVRTVPKEVRYLINWGMNN